MGLLIANDNLLTALGITNKEQFDQTFADFSEFETFVEKCGYEYDFDEEGNLILITPKSKEINTGIKDLKDYSEVFFTVLSLADNNSINFKTYNVDTNNGAAYDLPSNSNLYYSINNNDWIKFNNTPIVLNINDNCRFKCTPYIYLDNYRSLRLSCTNNINIFGNIVSLTKSENDFVSISKNPYVSYSIDYTRFIDDNSRQYIISAKNLILPQFNASYYFQYPNGQAYAMFKDCINLKYGPTFTRTTRISNKTNKYIDMFRNCKSLIEAPILPITELSDDCYLRMFMGCTSLTTAPELPATTLANTCYSKMFKDCTSLTTVELPATTLVSNCYQGMFQNCTSLNHIKAMFTTTPSISYMNEWLYNVAPTGTFVKNSAATWSNTDLGIPEGWTIETADS